MTRLATFRICAALMGILEVIILTAFSLAPFEVGCSQDYGMATQVKTEDHPMDLARVDHLLEPADVEAFFDGMMAAHFEAFHIPGASVAVVKDGKILFAKGYGYSNLEKHIRVDAQKTLFRIGSVSKLFTWTAVMQLTDKGMLDLDKDVNDYLKIAEFRVPATYPEPITMAHLMNHTAGFEDRGVGLFSHDPGSVRPLGEVLADTLPKRVRPPGEATAYSNHGAGLAGYVVECISGTPWATYVEENILKPLKMNHTSPQQPLPPDLQNDLAKGYVYSPSLARFEPQLFEYVPVAPAGAFSATATDMARFMIAHLQLGTLENSQILRAETARRMHSLSYSQDAMLQSKDGLSSSDDGLSQSGSSESAQTQWLGGIAHGFLEQPYGRLRTIGHGGDTFLFHSELRLVPSQNLGIFVAYNSPDGAIARDQLMRAFLDRYFGSYADWPKDSEPMGKAISKQPENLLSYTGVYGPTRVPRTTIDKLIELLSVTVVRPDPQDTTGRSLLVAISPMIGTQRFIQIGPGVFQEEDGPGRVAFAANVIGKPGRLLMGSAWMAEKLAWYKAPLIQISIVAACILFFLSAVIAWTIAWARQLKTFVATGLVRKRQAAKLSAESANQSGRPTTLQSMRQPKVESLLRALAWIVSALFLAVAGILAVVLGDPFSIAFGVPAGLRAGLIISSITAMLSPALVVAAAIIWRRRYFTVAGRVHYTLVAFAAVTFALWLDYWNLVGSRF